MRVIAQHYHVGGEGSWDYVVSDTAHHRLFIGRHNRVMVVDATDGRLLGEVQGIHGAHGTAIDLATNHGFATSGDDSAIVMFDLVTFATLGRAHAAEDADAIIFDAPSRRVFSFNGDAHSATVVEPEGGTLVTNIPLGGKPEYGVSAGDGMVYANLTDTSEVVEIDAKNFRVTRRWSTAPCRPVDRDQWAARGCPSPATVRPSASATSTGSPSAARSGRTPSPGSRDAAIRPRSRCGAPAAIDRVT